MNRILLLILIGAVTFVILLFANDPDIFEDVWLYLVGLSGAIIKLFQIIGEKIKTFAKDLQKQTESRDPRPTQSSSQQTGLPPVISTPQDEAVG